MEIEGERDRFGMKVVVAKNVHMVKIGLLGGRETLGEGRSLWKYLRRDWITYEKKILRREWIISLKLDSCWIKEWANEKILYNVFFYISNFI